MPVSTWLGVKLLLPADGEPFTLRQLTIMARVPVSV